MIFIFGNKHYTPKYIYIILYSRKKNKIFLHFSIIFLNKFIVFAHFNNKMIFICIIVNNSARDFFNRAITKEKACEQRADVPC